MAEQTPIQLDIGASLYTDDGHRVGVVRGVDDSGVYVATAEHVSAPTPSRYSTTAGEFDLMWRCWQCGEMGRISDIPDQCPSCGAPSEDLYYWTED